MNTLFFEDTVYVSDKQTQAEVFEEIYTDLLKKQLVTEDFLKNILEREQKYPTGLDLSPVSSALPNIAIPHTESDFVKASRIIPINLKHTLTFHNMISPDATIDVSFLFMILNENGEAQAGLLANIMDFINAVDNESLIHFFNLENPTDIYQFLEEHFHAEHSA
ncbi:PTS sugar transporter subunit IIA [Staphylococcus microti]|uniref:PTS sugar transporter subunit IIA n=1 Tax=Staphylococcus microti TaxID=569857 RepID=A0A0D6XRG7_9STAP|nr:PTS sugar transporter subunit IIA [Staphylococcus microti]KIX91045.1 PTS sugar transporter subunit IIA [Staphylococcus microti]PNZ81846.1 PTS sugar transporter subunit IIA [Staphylococcus microti]SUM57152.1 PTS system galactitol-specific transporter subunit IIA [Staphylococcus microti]